jgi:CBS domain-containing protein
MQATTPKPTRKRFLALTAADLMSTPVLTIPHNTSLREAACLLSGSHISGAPVVDAGGRCLGVLSSSDFITWARKGSEAVTVTSFIAPWGELVSVDDLPDEEIHHYMTAQPITVVPQTPVGELAQKMVDAHIHRLLVVEEERPRGIVTSTDVMAAVAREARATSAERGRPRPRVRRR